MFTKIKNDPSRTVLRLPRLGKIRLGIKKLSAKSGKEYPVETDYFVVPKEVQALYGPEPKQLPVMIPTENEDMFLRQYYAVYAGNQKLLCQGDGETAERRAMKTIGKEQVVAGIEKMACPGPDDCDFAKEKGCKARTDLMVILPEVSMGGAWQLSTGSTVSDIDIRSGLEMARAMVGRIAWIPMLLERTPVKIPDPKTGKMNTHHTVRLIPAIDLKSLNAIRQDNQRVAEWSKRYALPEPVVEGPEDDTPIDIVESMPGEDEAVSPFVQAAAVVGAEAMMSSPPPAPADPVNEIDPVASAQIRTDMVNDLRNSGSIAALEFVGAAIARISHRLMKADLDSLRMEYDRLLTEAKRSKRRVAS